MTDLPDFFLASTEGYDLETPRRCWQVRRVSAPKRDDLMLIRIDPPLIGQKYGLGAKDIEFVLIAPRHSGVSLFPIKEWPVYVHVARLIGDSFIERSSLDMNEMALIAWAEIYQTLDAAVNACQRTS